MDMEIVYVVYEDNGMAYEDHQVSVERIFASRESAEKFRDEKTLSIVFKIISKEDYYQGNTDDIMYTYEDYYEMEWQDWNQYQANSRYFITEHPINP